MSRLVLVPRPRRTRLLSNGHECALARTSTILAIASPLPWRRPRGRCSEAMPPSETPQAARGLLPGSVPCARPLGRARSPKFRARDLSGVRDPAPWCGAQAAASVSGSRHAARTHTGHAWPAFLTRVTACAALSGRQGRRGAQRDAGTSGKRLDAPCRPDSVALRVAPRRPPATSRASTVFPDTLFGPLLADRTPGRDAGRDPGEKCGLASRRKIERRRQPASCGRPARFGSE